MDAQLVLPTVEKVICVPEFRPLERRHPWHELIVPVVGDYRVMLSDDRLVRCPLDRILVMPAGTEHLPDLRPGQPLSFYCFQWWPSASEPDYRFDVRPDPHGRILYCCAWIWQLCSAFAPTAARPPATEAAIGHLAALITDALGAAPAVDQVDPRVRRVIEHMEVNLGEQNRIGDLAALVGLSRDGLIRLFDRETGTTPGSYLQRLRVEKAIALLAGTAHPLERIAAMVGIGSGSHLSNLVKRTTGRRPSTYR